MRGLGILLTGCCLALGACDSVSYSNYADQFDPTDPATYGPVHVSVRGDLPGESPQQAAAAIVGALDSSGMQQARFTLAETPASPYRLIVLLGAASMVADAQPCDVPTGHGPLYHAPWQDASPVASLPPSAGGGVPALAVLCKDHEFMSASRGTIPAANTQLQNAVAPFAKGLFPEVPPGDARVGQG
jgi:hypothetical protein